MAPQPTVATASEASASDPETNTETRTETEAETEAEAETPTPTPRDSEKASAGAVVEDSDSEETEAEETTDSSTAVRRTVDQPKEYPAAFYCTETRQLMTDPVVGPSGHSYERSAVALPTDEPGWYRPNKALKAIMESFESSPPLWLSPGRMPPEDYPRVFYCCDTRELMTRPVISRSGESYEHVNIGFPWEEEEPKFFYDNLALKAIMEEVGAISKPQEEEDAHRSESANPLAVLKPYVEQFHELAREATAATTTTTTTTTTTNIKRNPELEGDYPWVFFCTESRKLMNDPVVGSSGASYERSTVARRSYSTRTYYPNRALKAIMEETIALQEGGSRAALRRNLRFLQQSVSQRLHEMLPESAPSASSDPQSTTTSSMSRILQEPVFRPLNDAFYCPITFNLMHDPVIDPEGNTYERVAAENWIRVNRNSPITRSPVMLSELYPNKAIRQLLLNEKNKADEDQTMHPAIRKWKEERAPQATDVELGGALQATSNDDHNAASVIPSIGTVIGQGYPTTPSEWSQREHSRRRAMQHFLGIFLAAVCLVGFALGYGGLFFVLIFIMVVVIVFSKNNSSSSNLSN